MSTVEFDFQAAMNEPRFITNARRIAGEWQYAALDYETGERVSERHKRAVLIDANTATRMVQAFDMLKPANQAKVGKVGLVRFAEFVWKV